MKTPIIIAACVVTITLAGIASGQEKQKAEPKRRVVAEQPSSGALAEYVGRYGNKEITVRDGALHYQRIGGRGAVLRQTGKDTFALNEDAQITFKRDPKGAVTEMAIDWVSMPDQQYKREPLTAGPSSELESGQPVRKRMPDQSAAEPKPDAATLAQLSKIMSHLLDTIYVSPEIGSRLARQLQEKFAAGAYAEAATPTRLAEMLTSDVQAWANDRHLYVRHDATSDAGESILAINEWEKQKESRFPKGSGGGGLRRRVAGPSDHSGPQQSDPAFEAKILGDGVGYLKVDRFGDGHAAHANLVEAMNALAESKAVIIDLRDCPGGSADTVSFLASYFFGPEPRVLMNRYIRPTGERIQSTTVADIPGKRMPATNLYILTSSRTASAGESFAYTLQQYGRAKIVGETTAGAGYNNAVIPLGKGFLFSVSYGRPEHPRSGKGWEAVGVQPDVKIAADAALETAQKLATQAKSQSRVAGAGPEEGVRKLEREWLDAYEERDAAAMESILADDFVITHPDGRTQNKAAIVEMMKRIREKGGSSSSKFATEDVQARVDGDTVTLTGKLLQTSQRDGAPMRMQSAYTDTYMKRDGRWQVIRSELKRVEEP